VDDPGPDSLKNRHTYSNSGGNSIRLSIWGFERGQASAGRQKPNSVVVGRRVGSGTANENERPKWTRHSFRHDERRLATEKRANDEGRVSKHSAQL
jgi:hypothetical protein